jgi:3',5'-cyclic-AMP phosphodiesterase
MLAKHPFNVVSGGFIEHDHNKDGIDRRGFLKCMAWAGTGTLCVIEGGVLKSYGLGSHDKTTTRKAGGLNDLSAVGMGN